MSLACIKKIITPPLAADDIQLEPFDENFVSSRYVSWLNDPDVMRYSEQRHHAHTVGSCMRYLETMRGGGHAFWAIRVRGTSGWTHIGNISATVDYFNAVADLGILIGEREARGRSIGYRSWDLVCDYLLGEAGLRKLTAGTAHINAPMLKIMEKSGMIEEGRQRQQFMMDGEPVDLVFAGKFR